MHSRLRHNGGSKNETYREISSVGSEHLPYKQGVGGSNPSSPTSIEALQILQGFFVFRKPPIMYYTYIIHAASIDRYYVGISENPTERLKKHNAKNKGFTNQASDWKIVYLRKFESKREALDFEKQIKNWKSKIKIQKLIANSVGSEHPDA